MASVWIGSWGLFAVDEVGASITHILEKNDSAISSVLKPGYVMHEKNGVKFMIKKETAEQMGVVTLEMECDSPEFWDTIAYEVDLESQEFVIDFNSLNYQDYKIRNLYLVVEPYAPEVADWNISSNGFEYHNFSKTKIPVTQDVARIYLPLYKADFRSLDKTYPIDIKLEATSQHGSDSVACAKENVTTIPVGDFANFTNIEPSFTDGIFEPYDFENFEVLTSGEDSYIEKFIDYQRLRQSGDDLPSYEAALALLGKNLSYYPDENGDYEWEDENIKYKRIRYKKTVVGLYGDIRKSDLEDVESIIQVLHIIAPGLDISYSNKTSDVTLPIHITPCEDKLGKHIGCKDSFIGVYKWGDYIWVDGSLRGDHRSQVLIHEIGHALGLGHNLCWDSAMTYNSFAPNIPYLSYIDLMQLRILYHPDLQHKYSKYQRSSLLRGEVIQKLGLNEMLVTHHEENIEEACYQKPGAYDYLIEMQGIKK